LTDNNFDIKFGGDASGIARAAATASNQIANFTTNTKNNTAIAGTELNKLTDTLKQLSENTKIAADSAAGLKSYADWGFAISVASIAVTGISAAVTTAGTAIKLTATTIGDSALWILSKFRESLGGIDILLGQGVGAWIKYAESVAYVASMDNLVRASNDGLIASFGRLALKVEEAWRAQDIYSTGLVKSAALAIASAGAMDKFTDSISGSKFGSANLAIEKLAAQLTSIPHMTNEAAATIEARFASLPNSTVQLNEALIDITTKMTNTKEGAEALSIALSDAMSNPIGKGEEFLTGLKNVSAELLKQFDIDKRANDLNAMRSVILQAVAAKQAETGAEMSRELDRLVKSNEDLGTYGKIYNWFLNDDVAKLQAAKTELTTQVASLNALALKTREMANGFDEITNSARGIVNAVNPLTNQLDSAVGKWNTLNAAIANSKNVTQDMREAVKEVGTQVIDLRAKEAGGTNLQKQKNEDLKETIRLNQEGLEAAKTLVQQKQKEHQAAEDDLDAAEKLKDAEGNSVLTQTKKMEMMNVIFGLEKEMNDAQAIVDKKQLDAAKAKLELKLEAAQTPKEKEAASVAIATHEKENAVDPADEIRAQGKIEAAHRASLAAELEDDKAAATERYQIGIKEIADQKEIDLAAVDGSFNADEKKVEIAKAAAIKRYDLEQDYYQDLAALEIEGTKQYDANLRKMEVATATYTSSITKINVEANKKIASDFKSTFEQIGSNLSSSIMGMLEGTSKLRNLFQSLAKELVSMMLNAGMKMVADWAASQATMAALAAANAVKAITTDAAVAGAGAAAEVAPVAGPAALGIGASIAAGVAGMASMIGFDIGAWNLPGDTPAMVHKGELVMPAAEAGAFRSMLTGAASGKGGQGGNVNASASFNINTMDARSLSRFLSSNNKTVMKAMSQAVKQGAHLGMKGLAPL